MVKIPINVYVDLNGDKPLYIVEHRYHGKWQETVSCPSEVSLRADLRQRAIVARDVTAYDLFSIDHRTSIPLANIAKNKPYVALSDQRKRRPLNPAEIDRIANALKEVLSGR